MKKAATRKAGRDGRMQGKQICMETQPGNQDVNEIRSIRPYRARVSIRSIYPNETGKAFGRVAGPEASIRCGRILLRSIK